MERWVQRKRMVLDKMDFNQNVIAQLLGAILTPQPGFAKTHVVRAAGSVNPESHFIR